MYEELKVEITYLKTGNCVLQMSTPQGVVMIRKAPLRSQEANAMISLVREWLKWPGEIHLQCSIFELGNGGRWCYNRATGTWMACL